MSYEQEYIDLAIALDAVEVSVEALYKLIDVIPVQHGSVHAKAVMRASVMAGIAKDYIFKAQMLLKELEPACFAEQPKVQLDLSASVIFSGGEKVMASQGKEMAR